MPPARAQIVLEGKLVLSPDPSAELAAAALEAKRAAGLQRADFIVIALEPDVADDALARELELLAEARPAGGAPAPA